jgi:type II secretory pathway component GspD/PulD (secretin)
MRKDYQVCASYLQSLDLKLLDERKRAHTQEILASREMQPHAIVPTGVQEDSPGAAKATVSDQPKAPAVGEKPSPSLLAEVQKRQEIALQRLREEQLQSERDAGKLANQGDYAGAVKRLETALAAVRESGLDAEVTAAMQRRLDQRKKQYQTMSEQVAFAELQKDKMNANNEYNRKKFLFEEHKREQVADFMKQYNEAYKAGKYKDAAAFAMKAKEIDPDNPAAEVAAFKADVMRNLASDDRIKQAKAGGFADNIQDVARASIPPAESELPMSYGDKDQWFNKDKRKNKAALSVRQMSPQDKEVANLLNTVVSVDFKNKPLSEALDALREMTGVNIVPDKTFIDQDGIVMDQPVTMPLDRLPLRTVLRLMLQNCRLTYVIKDGVVLVTTPAGERGKMTEVIYPVADLVVQTDRDYPGDPVNQLVGKNNSQDNPYSQNLTWNKNTSPGDLAGGYTPGGGMGTQVPGKPGSMGQKSMVQILMELIRNTIEPGSWRDMGGSGHIDFYPVGMSLVVSQTPDIQEQIQLLLDRLRELQQLQVTVEVRFITLSENFYERIGVDMDFQFNDNQTKFAKQVVASAFAPPSVPNEPSHLDNVIVGLTPQGVFTNDLDIPVNVSSFERAALPSGFAGFPGQPGGNGGIDLGVAFLSSIEVFLFLEAAQGDIRSNVLTAPKITLFNGQTATLSSSLTQFLVLEVIPIRDPLTGLITFFPVNTPVPSTTTLTVTAIVSADRRYVTLSINPVITRIVNSSRTFSPVAGIVLQQPDIESLTVFTAVSVPDGGTILLGGIKNMNEQRLEFGPPILSKIPYVNRLFRNQSFGREARSLMIMVTPRIIIPEEEEEKLGQTFAF